jgi:hypothetical protein
VQYIYTQLLLSRLKKQHFALFLQQMHFVFIFLFAKQLHSLKLFWVESHQFLNNAPCLRLINFYKNISFPNRSNFVIQKTFGGILESKSRKHQSLHRNIHTDKARPSTGYICTHIRAYLLRYAHTNVPADIREYKLVDTNLQWESYGQKLY